MTNVPMMTVNQLAERIDLPVERWAHNCHGVSLAIVQARVYEGGRVARGTCTGVPGQHSWVVLGDPYDPKAPRVDATAWSYQDRKPSIDITAGKTGGYRPHGTGLIFEVSMPRHWGGDTIRLSRAGLSDEARRFLDELGPLDIRGWMEVGRLPHDGWPAGEILGWMSTKPQVAALIPIDHLGMMTDLNPGGLYLPGDADMAWTAGGRVR